MANGIRQKIWVTLENEQKIKLQTRKRVCQRLVREVSSAPLGPKNKKKKKQIIEGPATRTDVGDRGRVT